MLFCSKGNCHVTTEILSDALQAALSKKSGENVVVFRLFNARDFFSKKELNLNLNASRTRPPRDRQTDKPSRHRQTDAEGPANPTNLHCFLHSFILNRNQS